MGDRSRNSIASNIGNSLLKPLMLRGSLFANAHYNCNHACITQYPQLQTECNASKGRVLLSLNELQKQWNQGSGTRLGKRRNIWENAPQESSEVDVVRSSPFHTTHQTVLEPEQSWNGIVPVVTLGGWRSGGLNFRNVWRSFKKMAKDLPEQFLPFINGIRSETQFWSCDSHVGITWRTLWGVWLAPRGDSGSRTDYQ